MLELAFEFIGFFIQFVFWMFIVALLVRVFSENYRTEETEKEEIKDRLTKLIHVVQPEQHGDVTYWFDKETDAFLGQGCTDDEIIAQLKARFPLHIFITDEGKSAISGPEWKAAPLTSLLEPSTVNEIVGRVK